MSFEELFENIFKKSGEILIIEGDISKKDTKIVGKLSQDAIVFKKIEENEEEKTIKGIMYFPKQSCFFEGEFQNNIPYRGYWRQHENRRESMDSEFIYHSYPECHNVTQYHHYKEGYKYVGSAPYGYFEGTLKIYHKNGKICYNGQCVKSKKEGNGKEYYPNGRIRFVGEFKDNEIINGIEYYDNKNKLKRYEGDFSNVGRYTGKGTKYYKSGNVMYIGEFNYGKFDGEGVRYFDKKSQEIKEQGEFRNGKFVSGLQNKYIDGVKCTLFNNIDITKTVREGQKIQEILEMLRHFYNSPEHPPGFIKSMENFGLLAKKTEKEDE